MFGYDISDLCHRSDHIMADNTKRHIQELAFIAQMESDAVCEGTVF